MRSSGQILDLLLAGKLKMVFQCVAVVASLLVLHLGSTVSGWLHFSLVFVVWLAVLSTVYSGIGYVVQAARIIKPGK